jgi:hypothetical protein
MRISCWILRFVQNDKPGYSLAAQAKNPAAQTHAHILLGFFAALRMTDEGVFKDTP